MSDTEKHSNWAGHPVSPLESQDVVPRFCDCVSSDGQSGIAPNDLGDAFINLGNVLNRLAHAIERLNQNLEQNI